MKIHRYFRYALMAALGYALGEAAYQLGRAFAYLTR